MKNRTIAVAGTFDTKGEEYKYVVSLIEALGLKAFTIHTGVFEPLFEPDVSNKEIAAAAGVDIAELEEKKDRALATETLARGMEILIPMLYEQGKFNGILSFGGSGGTSMVTPAMRALPVGVPKVMVSTMASGNVSQYVGTSDILMMPSIVDVAGLNSISKKIFSNAVHAIAGMVEYETEMERGGKPLVAATMFGVTTPCIGFAKEVLEKAGYEVLVFHATGAGGRTMEALIRAGFFDGVLDITTTEWCDELFGGVLNAGPDRLEAAAEFEVPQVVSVGALDMVNFGPRDTVPKQYLDRNLYQHNPTVTLMRTTVEENVRLGTVLAEKLNRAKRDTVLMLPLKGVSAIDTEGGPFYGRDEDQALFETVKKHLNKDVEIVELDMEINDRRFAEAAAEKLIAMMKQREEEK